MKVDLGSLGDAHRALKELTEKALGPGVSNANGRIFRGLQIGEQSASGEVEASRQALAYGMSRFWQNTKGHVDRARQVTAFLDQILAEYAEADDLAKLKVEAVEARFNASFPKEPSAVPSHGHAAGRTTGHVA